MLKNVYALNKLFIKLLETGEYSDDHNSLSKIENIMEKQVVPFHSYLSICHIETGITIRTSDNVSYLNNDIKRMLHIGGAVDTHGLVNKTSTEIPEVQLIDCASPDENKIIDEWVEKTIKRIKSRIKLFHTKMEQFDNKMKEIEAIESETDRNADKYLSACTNIGIVSYDYFNKTSNGTNMHFTFYKKDEHNTVQNLSVIVDKDLNITAIQSRADKIQTFFKTVK